MLRRFLTGVTAAATALLAACEDAPKSTILFESGQANSYLDFVAARGPLLVTAHGGQALATGPEDLSQAVGGFVSTAITRRVVKTTPHAHEATEAAFQMQWVFDAGATMDPQRLCAKGVPLALTSPSAPGERLEVLAVFCNGTTLEAAVRGSVPYPASVDDKKFGELVKQITRQIFPQS